MYASSVTRAIRQGVLERRASLSFIRTKDMVLTNRNQIGNRLLSLLSDEDFARLGPHLEPVECRQHVVLCETLQPFNHVFFLDLGVGSIIVESPEGQKAEAGLFGRDGFSPTSIVMGGDRSPHGIIMQIPGRGHRIETAPFIQAVGESASLRATLLLYVQALNAQTSFTALSNAVHHIDERLARWILMCHDRCESDDIPLTHEFMSIMLAVRRPSVTTSLHVLEGNGFIEADRGYITIKNRAALEVFAGDAYGKPEAEYRRLLGAMW